MGYGVLRIEFVMPGELAGHPLAKAHARLPPPPPPEPPRAPVDTKAVAPAQTPAVTGALVQLGVGLATKAAESLIDAAALWAQPDVARLECVTPIDGFFGPEGRPCIAEACLVMHDGRNRAGDGRTMLGIFQVVVSADGTAFRFDVAHWEARSFQNEVEGLRRLFAREEARDIALKVEFLSPGAEGLGTRSVFVEQVFTDIDGDELAVLFEKDQRLPWMAMPRRPAEAGAQLPLNLKVTLLETEKPRQFAAWLLQQAQARKGELSALVKDAVQKAVDPGHAATERARQATAADAAFAAYRTAWDDLAAHRKGRPADGDAAAATWKAGEAVRLAVVESRRTVARAAFDAADLPWAGDLPVGPPR